MSKDPKLRPSLDDITFDIINPSPFYIGCTLSGISTNLSVPSGLESSPDKNAKSDNMG